MSDAIGILELRRMFAEAAEQIRSHQDMLSQLDSIGGDGDHGVTMVRAMEMLENELSTDGDKPLEVRLRDAGWGVLSVGGGASGALVGTFIAGMGDVELGQSSDCRQLAASFAAGLQAVQRQTPAQPGDKTMMDALVPAIQALEAAANSGEPIAHAMKTAADAARSGAESTKSLIAKHGRARFLGERTRGSADAGATSIALVFQGFSSALADHREH